MCTMNKVSMFAAAALVVAGTQIAGAEETPKNPNIVDVPQNPLSACLTEVISGYTPKDEEGKVIGEFRAYGFKVSEDSLIYKFESGVRIGHDDGVWSAAYIYPGNVGQGSMEIVVADMGPANDPGTDVTAIVQLDKLDVSAPGKLYRNTGFKADKANQDRVDEQATVIVGQVRKCMKPEDLGL